jgi:hypothetical protein
LKLVERGKLGGRQQLERRVRCRSIELRLRGSQGPPPPLRRIGGQLGRARQEGRSRRRAPTGLGPVGRALQLAGHRLVDTHCRLSTMPRPTIGIGIRIGRLSQRPMRISPLRRGSRSIDGGARQRVTEPHALVDHQQALRLGLVRGRRRDPEPLGGAPEQQRIPERLRRRNQQQTPRLIRERLELSNEALLDVS